MMRPLQDRFVRVTMGTATVYRFTFEHSGWAIFTVNDETGELNIQSDWDDYCYRWNIAALGERNGRRMTLTEFLARCDTGYLVGKLCMGLHRDQRLEFDEVATRKAMTKHAAELYRDGGVRWYGGGATLPKDVVKELYAEIRRYCRRAASDIYEAYYFVPELVERYFDNLHEWFVYRDTGRVRFLGDQLLPFFLSHLARESG